MEMADPGLTIAIALLAGLLAQTAAHHLRLPGIVLLLATGALLGPDVLRIVNPDSVRPALPYLVSFAVAVILFEGGMNLEIRRLRRASSVIRRLVTVGSVITLAGATLAAHLALGWAWQLSFLFGVLVIVTGPTVVSPLVRRIRLQKHLRIVLEGEGVLIDPIGAIFAVVILDVLLHPSLASAVSGFLEIAAGLGLGALFGFAAGHLLATVLRWRGLIPASLENVFVLSAVLTLFYASNALVAESGLAAVAVAGIVVGNVRTLVQRDLAEFKEQLTMLFIGMLFVLLAADIRFVELEALGFGGLLTVAALILIVRPIGVAICAAGSTLKFKEQVFMAWMAPRGVVAAAVASFFALRMDAAGFVGGSALQALVFLVIAVTVTVDGLTGGIVGTLLGVRLPRPQGWLIVGAGPLGRMLGRALRDAGQPVTFLDSGTSECHDAEEEDFPVIFGNALEESTLLRADPERFIGCIAVTPNEEVNFLVASRVYEGFDLAEVWAAIQARNGNLTRDMIHSINASLLFAGQSDPADWDAKVRKGGVAVECWEYRQRHTIDISSDGLVPTKLRTTLLPMLHHRGRGARRVTPVGESTRIHKRQRITFLLVESRRSDAEAWLGEQGWRLVAPIAVEAPPPPKPTEAEATS